MKHLVDVLGTLFLGFAWLAGIVLAKGIWSTLATIFFPPYAWYLFVELVVSLCMT